MTLDAEQLGVIIEDLDLGDELEKLEDLDWHSWAHNPITRRFFGFLTFKLIDIQKAMATTPLKTQDQISEVSELQGRYAEIRELIDCVNYLVKGKTSDEEGSQSDG